MDAREAELSRVGKKIRGALDAEAASSSEELRLTRRRFIDHVTTRDAGRAIGRRWSWLTGGRISFGVVGAAAIGAVLTATATLAYALHVATGAEGALVAVIGITVVMVIFPALESLLGLCVGCVLFGQLMRLGLVPEEVCLDCADITRRAQVRSLAS